MAHIEEMDPALIAKLIEGVPNIVGPAVDEEDRLCVSTSCPRCGGGCRRVAGSYAEMATSFPPRFNLECLACGCVFSPRSGMICSLGNLANAFERDVSLVRGAKPPSGL